MMEDWSPQRQALVAMGLGLMGSRGSGGFGKAGLLGMEQLERAKKMKMLEEENQRREEDRKVEREMRALQMKQIEQAMQEREGLRQAWGEVGSRFSAQRPQAPSAPVGPLNPDMSPVDAAMIARNNAQAQQQSAFPFTWDEVLAINVKTRGQIDLRDAYKDSMKTEEVKPGTIRQDIHGNREWIPAFDLERGVQGGPSGVQSIPGYDRIMSDRELSKQRAGAQAGAELDLVTIVDPRPGPTQGKRITVPRSEAAALSRQANNFPPVGSQAPVQAPQAAPQPAPVQPQPQPPAPAQSPPMAQDRARILQDELTAEMAKLQELQSTSPASLKLKYGAGFDPRAALERAQTNIAALQRELGGPRPAAPAAQPPVRPDAGMTPPISPEQAKIDRERQAEVALNLNKARITAQNVSTVLDNVKAALPLVSWKTTGFTGAKMAKVEGTDAFQLRANIEPIKAALGFDQLQLMRDFSKTGGAVGQLAVQELVSLQSRIRNLTPDQQESYLRANLFAIENHYRKYWEIMRQAWKDQYGIDLKNELPGVFSGNSEMTSDYTDSLIKNYLRGPKK